MFWGEFRRPLAALDRCTLNKGAIAFKIVRGALKWPLKGGSRLIEVAATAGLTVFLLCSWKIKTLFFKIRRSKVTDYAALTYTHLFIQSKAIEADEGRWLCFDWISYNIILWRVWNDSGRMECFVLTFWNRTEYTLLIFVIKMLLNFYTCCIDSCSPQARFFHGSKQSDGSQVRLLPAPLWAFWPGSILFAI